MAKVVTGYNSLGKSVWRVSVTISSPAILIKSLMYSLHLATELSSLSTTNVQSTVQLSYVVRNQESETYL